MSVTADLKAGEEVTSLTSDERQFKASTLLYEDNAKITEKREEA